MPSRKRATSSISTFQIIGVVLLLIVVGILLAYLFAPEKPMAPPNSRLTYETPPPRERVILPGDPTPLTSPEPDAETGEDAEPADEEPLEEPQPSAFSVHVRVLDEDTLRPVRTAWVRATREWTPAEEADWTRRNRGAMEAPNRDLTLLGELSAEERLLRHEQQGRTDRRGRVSLGLEQPGHYALRVSANGYLPWPDSGFDVVEANPTARIEVKLNTGAKISGRVLEEGSNAPVEGALVVWRRVEEADEHTNASSAETDDQGRYTLSGCTVGAYGVSLDLENIPYLPGEELPYYRIDIISADQEVTGIDFKVKPAGTVWGYLTTPDNTPVRGHVILCTSESIVTQAMRAVMRMAPPLTAGSDKNTGYYEMRGVPLNEEWKLHADASGYPPQLSDPFLLTNNHRSARVDVFMFAGTAIYGIVVDTKGNAVPGAQIACFPTMGKLLAPMENPHAFRDTRSDDNGEFVLDQIPAGSYQVYAMKEGFKYALQGIPVYPDGYNDIVGFRVTLVPKETGEHAIYGVVMDVDGRPILGADVMVAGLSSESFHTEERSTETDVGGNFRFDGMEAGSYQVIARREGYAAGSPREVLLNQELEIVIQRSALVRGRVLVAETGSPPESYSVRAVALSFGGTGMFGAMEAGARRSASFNNPDGSFELELAAGAYDLIAEAPGLAPGRTEVELASAEIREGVTVYVSQEGGAIRGRVRTVSGSSPQGTQVRLVRGGGAAETLLNLASSFDNDNMVLVDQSGEFEFTMLAAGDYEVIAKHTSYPTVASGTLALPERSEINNVELVLGRGGRLEGYVFEDGQPVPGIMVVVMSQHEPQTATTDANGWYTFEDIPAGEVTAMRAPSGDMDLVGMMAGGLSGIQTIPLTIEAGQTVRYDFGSGTGTQIVGQCLPAPPNIFSGGFIVIRAPGPAPHPRCTVVDGTTMMNEFGAPLPADGIFTIDDVAPGQWQIDVYYSGAGLVDVLSLTYRHTQLIEITPEDAGGRLEVVLEIPPCS